MLPNTFQYPTTLLVVYFITVQSWCRNAAVDKALCKAWTLEGSWQVLGHKTTLKPIVWQ